MWRMYVGCVYVCRCMYVGVCVCVSMCGHWACYLSDCHFVIVECSCLDVGTCPLHPGSSVFSLWVSSVVCALLSAPVSSSSVHMPWKTNQVTQSKPVNTLSDNALLLVPAVFEIGIIQVDDQCGKGNGKGMANVERVMVKDMRVCVS